MFSNNPIFFLLFYSPTYFGNSVSSQRLSLVVIQVIKYPNLKATKIHCLINFTYNISRTVKRAKSIPNKDEKGKRKFYRIYKHKD